MAHSPLIWAVSCLFGLCTATPAVTFPFNSQVPPVATPGQPFSFVFSSSTFSSTEKMTYSLQDAPAWLSIDSAARHIYGTPTWPDAGAGGAGGVVGVPFALVAADSSGSVSLDATLVLSQAPLPSVALPLASQLPNFGPFSPPSSVIMGPGMAFAMPFSNDTFSDPAGTGLTYYAVAADNTPLPAWVSFNAGELRFSGTTPPLSSLVQVPQTFSLKLIATNVVGFSAASLSFSMVVGNNKIAANGSLVVLNAVSGEPLSYTQLRSRVEYDGQPATREDTVKVASTPGLPSWLSVDRDTWEISGTPPDTAASSSFTVTLQDSFSDTLNITVLVNVTNGLFKGSLPQWTVSEGQDFLLDLGPYLSDPSDTDLSIDTEPPVTWVHLDQTRKEVFGHVPSTPSTSSLTIGINATSKSSGLEMSQRLPLRMEVAKPQSSTASSANSSPTLSSSPSPAPTSPSSKPGGALSKNKIIVATLIPLLALLLILSVVLFCIRRRGKQSGAAQPRPASWPLQNSLVAGAGRRAESSIQSLVRFCDTEGPPVINRSSRHKSYADAAVGNIHAPRYGAGPKYGTGSQRSRVAPAASSPCPSISDGATEFPSAKTPWLAVITQVMLRKPKTRGCISRPGYNEKEDDGLETYRSLKPLEDGKGAAPGSVSAAGLATDDVQSVRTLSDPAGSSRHGVVSNPETESFETASSFDDSTTVASNIPSSPPWPLENHVLVPTTPGSQRQSGPSGRIARLMARLRKKKKRPSMSVPQRGPDSTLPASDLSQSSPTSAAEGRLATDAADAEVAAGSSLDAVASAKATSIVRKGSPPPRPPRPAAPLPPEFINDALCIPYDITTAQSSPAPSTWSTVYSSSGSDLVQQVPIGPASTGFQPNMSYVSSIGSSQANWRVAGEFPVPTCLQEATPITRRAPEAQRPPPPMPLRGSVGAVTSTSSGQAAWPPSAVPGPGGANSEDNHVAYI